MAESDVLGGIAPRDYTAPEAGYGISAVGDPRITALAELLKNKRVQRAGTQEGPTTSDRLQKFRDKAAATQSAMKGQTFRPVAQQATTSVSINPLDLLQEEYIKTRRDLIDRGVFTESDLGYDDTGMDPLSPDASYNKSYDNMIENMAGMLGKYQAADPTLFIGPEDYTGFRPGDEGVVPGQFEIGSYTTPVAGTGLYGDADVAYKSGPGALTAAERSLVSDQGLASLTDYFNKLGSTQALNYVSDASVFGPSLVSEAGPGFYLSEYASNMAKAKERMEDPNYREGQFTDPIEREREQYRLALYGDPYGTYGVGVPSSRIRDYLSGSDGADLSLGLTEDGVVTSNTYLNALRQARPDNALVESITQLGSSGYTNPYEAMIYGQAFNNLQNKFADKDAFTNYFADRFVTDTQGPVSPAPRKTYSDYSKELAANRVSGIGGLAPGLV